MLLLVVSHKVVPDLGKQGECISNCYRLCGSGEQALRHLYRSTKRLWVVGILGDSELIDFSQVWEYNSVKEILRVEVWN